MLGKALFAIATTASTSVLLAQSGGQSIPLPDVMHFCAQHCLTFRLENGQFTNYTNLIGQHNVKRVFSVERFTPESVIIRRVDTGSHPMTAAYSGRMSPGHNSLSGAGWQVTWGSALNTIAGSDEERDKALAAEAEAAVAPLKQALVEADNRAREQARAEAAKHPQLPPTQFIRLPPGASPEFAKFPADVRAVLQPEYGVLPTRLKLNCEDIAKDPHFESGVFTKESKSYGLEALEIGKFAYRAADFPRGACWLQRSADLGTPGAYVIQGVAALMGWGGRKDPDEAFQKFKLVQDRHPTAWSAHFLEKCYEQGIGTPVNRQMQAQMGTWIMLRRDGWAMEMSIGDDDARQHWIYERMWAFVEPPMKTRRVCEVQAGGRAEICRDVNEGIDQEKLQEQVNAIDRKYQH
jgi:hypothetical protein